MALGRKTGGRKKGTPNKSTAAIMALAQAHTADAIVEPARIMLRAGLMKLRKLEAEFETLDPEIGASRHCRARARARRERQGLAASVG